jgi:hypothetical protein
MKPEVKKEIQLNPKLVEIIVKTNQEIREFQNQINIKTAEMSHTLTGVCLNEGLDITTEGVFFSEDFTILFVYDLPVLEGEEKPKGKVAKMKV